MAMCVQPWLLRVGLVGVMLWGTSASLKAQPADTNYDESKVPAYKLPPLLPADVAADSDDQRAAIWRQSRRAEVQRLFEQHVYGKTPTDPVEVQAELLESSDQALGGAAVRQQWRVTVSPSPAAEGLDPGRSIDIHVLIYAPKSKAADETKAAAFMGLNFYGNQTVHTDPDIHISAGWMRSNDKIGVVDHRATEQTRGKAQQRWQPELLIARGYGLVTMYCGDIDPDNYQHDFSDGVHPLFYEAGQTQPAADEWGAIGGWAWGLSTVRAWLARRDDALVDAERIAVIGHSRLGKTALWAGAQDENFAMVISNNSGCGGAALYRRCYGERIHHMIKPIGYWFCRDHAQYAKRESELPVDQHMLLALVAPRPLYVASARGDRWADPKGEFLSAKHASPVYEWMGQQGLPAEQMPAVDQPVAGRVGYHVRTGEHDVTRFDWQQYLDFADENL